MASNTSVEIQLTPREMQYHRAWESYAQQRGQQIERRTIVQNILRGILPPGYSETSAAGRANIQAGNIGMYEMRPDVPVDRDLSPIEQDIWRINRDSVLRMQDDDPYTPPPGDEIKRKEEDKTLDINWAEFGWAESNKRRAKERLMNIFQIDAVAAERAVEVLLLAGYTADEVISRAESQKEEVEKYRGSNYRYAFWQIFKIIFSDNGQHEIHDSSAKIVFGKEAFEEQKQSYADPGNMEELALRLAWTGAAGGESGDWMQHKTHPMFEARGKWYKDANGIKRYRPGAKFYVNENSFLHWFRTELDVLYDIWGPDSPIQVMDQVQSRISSMNIQMLRGMVEKQEAFKSEDGKTKYHQLWLKLQLEPGEFQGLYNNNITYRQAAAQGLDKWMEAYEQMTLMNPLTKLGFRTNAVQQLLSGTNEYREGRADVDGGRYLSDNKLGGAFAEMVLAFYNLGDFKELQRVLGAGSSFFTREGWEQAMKDIAKRQGLRPGGALKLAPDEKKSFDEAFKYGLHTKKGRSAFIKFVNTLGTSNLPGSHMELIVTRAIFNSTRERFGLQDTAGTDLIAAQAWFFNRFMGGLARNDVSMTGYKDRKGRAFYTPNPSVHDKPAEMFRMRENREKYAAKGGGKPFGNIQTIAQFKAAALDPMVAIATMQEVPVIDAFGRKIEGQKAFKSLLQVISEAHGLRVRQLEYMKRMRGSGRFSEDAIKEEEKVQSRIYQNYVAENAAFHENAHREYMQVHLKAGKKWMERIMGGKGLDFNNFTGYDAWGGVTVKRDVLIKDLQKEMIGLTRDMVKKYKWMNFNDDRRIPYYNRQTGEYGFRDGKLGEEMFGYDMLNRKEFWLVDEKGRPVKENGRHVIDYSKLDTPEGRVQLMKQMFMTELAGDMINHQIVNSGDQRFKHVYYLNMLDVLRTMPGKLIVDEFRKHGINVEEGFFSDEDFKWLKARALNGNVLGINLGSFGFHLKWWISSLWDKQDKEGLGFGKMFRIIAKEAFSGSPTA